MYPNRNSVRDNEAVVRVNRSLSRTVFGIGSVRTDIRFAVEEVARFILKLEEFIIVAKRIEKETLDYPQERALDVLYFPKDTVLLLLSHKIAIPLRRQLAFSSSCSSLSLNC